MKRQSQKYNILIADENPDLLVRQQLEARGHHTHYAADGISALEAVDDFIPDIVLLDLNLPGLDGCEVLETMRDMPHMKHAVYIAMSEHAASDCRTAAVRFAYTLKKPVDFHKLRLIIENLPKQTAYRLSEAFSFHHIPPLR